MRSGCDGGSRYRCRSVHVSISHRVWKGQWLFIVGSSRLLLWIEISCATNIFLCGKLNYKIYHQTINFLSSTHLMYCCCRKNRWWRFLGCNFLWRVSQVISILKRLKSINAIDISQKFIFTIRAFNWSYCV